MGEPVAILDLVVSRIIGLVQTHYYQTDAETYRALVAWARTANGRDPVADEVCTALALDMAGVQALCRELWSAEAGGPLVWPMSTKTDDGRAIKAHRRLFMPPEPEWVRHEREQSERRRERLAAVTVAEGDAHRVIAARLAENSGLRIELANRLRAKIQGRAAKGITCPACGDQSVWYYLEPGQMNGAKCNHEQSCAWYGSLYDLARQTGMAA